MPGGSFLRNSRGRLRLRAFIGRVPVRTRTFQQIHYIRFQIRSPARQFSESLNGECPDNRAAVAEKPCRAALADARSRCSRRKRGIIWARCQRSSACAVSLASASSSALNAASSAGRFAETFSAASAARSGGQSGREVAPEAVDEFGELVRPSQDEVSDPVRSFRWTAGLRPATCGSMVRAPDSPDRASLLPRHVERHKDVTRLRIGCYVMQTWRNAARSIARLANSGTCTARASARRS